MAVTYTQSDNVIFEKRDSDGLVDYVNIKVIGTEDTDADPKTNNSWYTVRVALVSPTAEGSVTKAQIDTAFATAKTTVPSGQIDDAQTIIANHISDLKSDGAAPDSVAKDYTKLPTA